MRRLTLSVVFYSTIRQAFYSKCDYSLVNYETVSLCKSIFLTMEAAAAMTAASAAALKATIQGKSLQLLV